MKQINILLICLLAYAPAWAIQGPDKVTSVESANHSAIQIVRSNNLNTGSNVKVRVEKLSNNRRNNLNSDDLKVNSNLNAVNITASAYSEEPEVQDMLDNSASKSFNKSYKISNNHKISIYNKYGSISIKTWNKPEAKVEAQVQATSTSQKDADDLLRQINIEESLNSNELILKTTIDNASNNFGKSVRNGKVIWRREISVKYTIYVPNTVALNLQQNYGGIDLGSHQGPTALEIKYGNLSVEHLNHQNNYVSVQYGKVTINTAQGLVLKNKYGSGVNINSVDNLDLEAQYVGVTIGTIKNTAKISQSYGNQLSIKEVNKLDLSAKYVKINIDRILQGNPLMKIQYGSLNLGTVPAISLNTQYTNVSINELRGNGKFDMQYNNLSIAQISPHVKSLDIETRYVNIKLGFQSSYQGDFQLVSRYGSFNYGRNISAEQLGEGRTEKKYIGKIGRGGTNNVSIGSQYGSISLNN